jgi:hypothetical protein
MVDLLAVRNLPPLAGGKILALLILDFALGVAAVWTYAAIQPRFGAGRRTAVVVGFVVWLPGYLIASLTSMTKGLIPPSLMAIVLAYSLVQMVVAAMAGASLYRDSSSWLWRVLGGRFFVARPS